MSTQLRSHPDAQPIKRFKRYKGYAIYAYTIFNSECCNCARMRFHCENSLVVLRGCVTYKGTTAAKSLAFFDDVGSCICVFARLGVTCCLCCVSVHVISNTNTSWRARPRCLRGIVKNPKLDGARFSNVYIADQKWCFSALLLKSSNTTHWDTMEAVA